MNIKRQLNYFKEWFIVDTKLNLEYKINFVSTTVITTISFFSVFMFVSIFKNKFSEFLILTDAMVYFYMFNTFFFMLMFGTFTYSKYLQKRLLSGLINTFAVKPLPIIFQYFLQSARTRRAYIALFHLIGLIVTVVCYHLPVVKVLISLIISLLGGIMFTTFIMFIDSFAFFMKSVSYQGLYFQVNDFIRDYPYMFFKDAPLFKILIITPIIYISSVPTMYVFNIIDNKELLNYVILMLLTTLILGILTHYMWKVGLKRYEAFG